MPAAKKSRRTPEQQIADLQAKIEELKARAERKKVQKDPALRHIAAAVRSIDKALSETEDGAIRTALNEVRPTLSACLALTGAPPVDSKGTLRPRARRTASADAGRVLEYISAHPGARSEEMVAEFGTDAAALRAVLHQLRDEGKIRPEGKARGTRYFGVGSKR